MTNPTERGMYLLCIRTLQYQDGRVEFLTQSLNQEVPSEAVIAHLEAALEQKKREFFDSLNKDAAGFKEE